MKISIITTALSENYGAALQTYALEKSIRSMGHDVTTYRYIDKKRITYGLNIKRKVLHQCWKIVRYVLSCGLKRKHFCDFRKKYINLTSLKYDNNSELITNPGVFDVFVSGSDQIWNPEIFLYDYSYFLNYATGRKISYGSSFGRANFTSEQLKKCKKLLDEFEAISVRESHGRNILKTKFGLDAEVVLDPTLLLDFEEWNAIIPQKQKVSDPYVLCYVMPGDSLVTNSIERIAKILARKNNLKIIRLGLKEYKIFQYGVSNCDITAGPLEFLQYFRDAEFIVTNSFHGTAFSLNFSKKAFIPINENIQEENCLHDRIISLVTLLGAENMIIPVKSENDKLEGKCDSSVNFNNVSIRLKQERDKSKEFLVNAIRGIDK